jgi:choline dehydrogenase-like flavoprotein
MGTDPAASVCDPWGRLHDVANVWIADGGTWPTSAAFNPVLTQQALAWRTAAYMVAPDDPLGVLPEGHAAYERNVRWQQERSAGRGEAGR